MAGRLHVYDLAACGLWSAPSSSVCTVRGGIGPEGDEVRGGHRFGALLVVWVSQGEAEEADVGYVEAGLVREELDMWGKLMGWRAGAGEGKRPHWRRDVLFRVQTSGRRIASYEDCMDMIGGLAEDMLSGVVPREDLLARLLDSGPLSFQWLRDRGRQSGRRHRPVLGQLLLCDTLVLREIRHHIHRMQREQQQQQQQQQQQKQGQDKEDRAPVELEPEELFSITAGFTGVTASAVACIKLPSFTSTFEILLQECWPTEEMVCLRLEELRESAVDCGRHPFVVESVRMAARYRAARHQGYFGEREHTLMVRSCLEEDRRREGDDKAHSKIPSVRQLGKHLLKVLTATGAHGGEWSSRASQQMRAHYSDLCAVAAGLCRHLDLLVALCAALWEHQPKGGAGSRSSTVDDTLEEAVLAVRKVVDLLDRSEREPLLRQLGTLIPAPPTPP